MFFFILLSRLPWRTLARYALTSFNKKLYDGLFEQFLKIDMTNIQNIKNGELMSYFTQDIKEISTKAKNIRTLLNTFIAESIYGAKIIKIFNIQREKKEECKTYTKAFRDKKSKQGIFEALLPGVMSFLQNIGISLILLTCLNKWFGVTLEIGYIYIFITYLKQFLAPLTRMVENIEIAYEKGNT